MSAMVKAKLVSFNPHFVQPLNYVEVYLLNTSEKRGVVFSYVQNLHLSRLLNKNSRGLINLLLQCDRNQKNNSLQRMNED